MRLLRANLRKLVRRPATWVTFLLLVALVGLLYLALIASSQQAENPQAKLAAQLVVTFPGAYANAASLVLGLGGILALTFGAAIAGSEWPWGTLKAAIARGESRSRYTLVGYLGVVVAVVIGFLAAYALALVGAAIGSAILGVPLDGAGQQSAILTLPELIGRGIARPVDGGGDRVRDRDCRPQPARGHRRGHRAAGRPEHRRDLPAQRLQVVPVLRGLGGDRRHGGWRGRWRRRRRTRGEPRARTWRSSWWRCG